MIIISQYIIIRPSVISLYLLTTAAIISVPPVLPLLLNTIPKPIPQRIAPKTHDVYEPLDPPYRREIPIYKPSDRIGSTYIQVDPKKIVGVVRTNKPDEARHFTAPDVLTDKIGQNVAEFLVADMKRGIIPSCFLPIQSGVGNIANAVLGGLGRDKTVPPFEMYTEVIQNSVIKLMQEGRIKFGSACSLTVTNDCLDEITGNIDFFKDKIVLRQSEISNNPEIIRRLGIISINTAIEVDLYGNVNSTHAVHYRKSLPNRAKSLWGYNLR